MEQKEKREGVWCLDGVEWTSVLRIKGRLFIILWGTDVAFASVPPVPWN